jgi:cell shape-determining protein MreC
MTNEESGNTRREEATRLKQTERTWEMVCSALDVLHQAQVRILSLEQQNQALREELARYVRSAVE